MEKSLQQEYLSVAKVHTLSLDKIKFAQVARSHYFLVT